MQAEQALVVARGEYADLLEFCSQLITTGFLPKAVNTPAKAALIILTGREMGMGPMQSLRCLHVVEGKVTMAADLQLAMFKKSGGKAKFTTLTQERAVLALELPNGDQHAETFTMADARAAGLGHKDNWKKYPKAMLRSRVITAGLKSVGFEATTGLYDPEELNPDAPVVEIDASGVNGEPQEGEIVEGPTLDTAPAEKLAPVGSAVISEAEEAELSEAEEAEIDREKRREAREELTKMAQEDRLYEEFSTEPDVAPTAAQYGRLKEAVDRLGLSVDRGDSDLKVEFPESLMRAVYGIESAMWVTVWRRKPDEPDLGAKALEKAIAWMESQIKEKDNGVKEAS